MSEFKIEQKFDIDLAVEVCTLHNTEVRSHAEKRRVFIALAIILGGMSFVANRSSQLDGPLWFLIWVTGPLLLAALIAWPPKRWARFGVRPQIIAHRKHLGPTSNHTVYRFDEEAIHIEDEVFGGKIAWRDLYGWFEGAKLILIYRGPQFYYFIAKDGVDSAILNSLRERLLSSPAKQF